MVLRLKARESSSLPDLLNLLWSFKLIFGVVIFTNDIFKKYFADGDFNIIVFFNYFWLFSI